MDEKTKFVVEAILLGKEKAKVRRRIRRRVSYKAPNSYPDSCVCDKCYLRENGEKPSPCGVRRVKGKKEELIKFLILLRRGMRK